MGKTLSTGAGFQPSTVLKFIWIRRLQIGAVLSWRLGEFFSPWRPNRQVSISENRPNLLPQKERIIWTNQIDFGGRKWVSFGEAKIISIPVPIGIRLIYISQKRKLKGTQTLLCPMKSAMVLQWPRISKFKPESTVSEKNIRSHIFNPWKSLVGFFVADFEPRNLTKLKFCIVVLSHAARPKNDAKKHHLKASQLVLEFPNLCGCKMKIQLAKVKQAWRKSGQRSWDNEHDGNEWVMNVYEVQEFAHQPLATVS